MTSLYLVPVVALCLFCANFCQSQEDVDTLLEDVFGKPSTDQQQPQEEGQTNMASCTCMPFYNCKKNNTQDVSGNAVENEYGENIIDIRIDPDDPEAECKHYLDRCCSPMDNIPTKEPPVTPPVTPLTPTANVCGVRHQNGVGFKITGDTNNEANYGEFPWMVAIIRRDRVIADITLKVMECGGSIIHPRVILTGAHCVKGKKDLYIRAGEWDTQTEKEEYPTQDRDVKQVIIHEQYYAGGLHNDVALIVLDKPLELNPVVSTLCLPEQGENMDNRNCVVPGWGKDSFGKEGKYQVILKRVDDLRVVERGACQEALRKTRLGPRFKLHDSFICAGGQVGKDACKGDGGGPLACPSSQDPNVYVQADIVA
ncbi:phenoloxidase-activating factor 2-like isoform X2 [Macrosteles quadrilineatus]|uniref:phenoloxidase-activating factor 2-like isoform X2 n=1 Tax=Macrosteles quadrilineatus TaxID=74068 RepID=UPI0023E1A705|nr:phenoloxidase-activating factor 2-like isoform X2 [Macrosteles quadrilineatus]